jgi:hypothetical protein
MKIYSVEKRRFTTGHGDSTEFALIGSDWDKDFSEVPMQVIDAKAATALEEAEKGLTIACAMIDQRAPAYATVSRALELVREASGIKPRWLK